MMRKFLLCSAAVLLPCATGLDGGLVAQEQATPEEVVQKVKQAADYLAGAGEAGLDAFKSQDSEYVWKDTYVVVNDCQTMTLAAHPVRPDLTGSSMQDMPAFGDMKAAQVGAMLCESGERPEGGWVEYMFPKPGEKEPSRKLSYSKSAEGTPYVLTGGIYSDDATVDELEMIITK